MHWPVISDRYELPDWVKGFISARNEVPTGAKGLISDRYEVPDGVTGFISDRCELLKGGRAEPPSQARRGNSGEGGEGAPDSKQGCPVR